VSYDLYASHCRTFHFSNGDWPELLDLARLYGWDPTGTAAPGAGSGEPWSGGYLSNDHQGVSTPDAAGLADAIEQALLDLEAGVCPTPIERFSKGKRGLLRRFIRFCREGGFAIG
jgi:hypothetical protein